MSSTVIAKNVQIGADGTASNNFTIFQPATPDGTLRIGNGNTGITSSLVTLTSAGAFSVTGTTTTTLSVAGNEISAVNSLGFRNRIINGDMRIDQRNAGASVTAVNGDYIIDRWRAISGAASKFTMGRSAGGVTPPTSFTNYLGLTSLSAYTVGASEIFAVRQPIEGFNTADLGWGTANAQAVTLSFWVRSSLTGTFGATLRNSAQDRTYPLTYTVSAANTWEFKTANIAGDTSGTWLTNNGIGIELQFSIGAGSSVSGGTANAWNAGSFQSPSGCVSVVGTNGATFYITGVQLEAGTVASPFERRDYGRELMMCQRYYESYYFRNTTYGMGSGTSTIMNVPIKVTKRATPTTTIGSDPDGWTNNFPSASATNYNADSLAILSTGATSSVVRYGAILSFSAEL